MKIFSLLMLLLVSACSSLSKEDCVGTNWLKTGYKDGSRGVDPKRIEDYKLDCSEHGLRADSNAYLKGHKEGLVYFCTYKNGLDAGLDGNEFKPFCSNIDPTYNKGYEEGYRVFKIEELEKKKQNKLDKQRESAKDEVLSELRHAYGDKECSFNSDCKMEAVCHFNRCQISGQTCTYNSDCGMITGNCDRFSRYTRFDDLVEMNVCRFQR